MTETSRLTLAADRLRMVYGTAETVDEPSRWMLFLRILLIGPGAVISDDVRTVLDSTILGSPESAAQSTTGQLLELLEKVPRGPQKASLIRAVAVWWLSNLGDQTSPEWSGEVATYRESLRKIRGLGPATVDELLMYAAQLPVFPVHRGMVRVAVRHGWLDLPLEDDETQAFFVQGLQDAEIDRREFSQLISRVAEDFCGREPKCDGCPLQPLLPPGGPLNPDSV